MTLEELEKVHPQTVTIKEAAVIMGVTPRFLQMALMQDKFPFGVGVKMAQNEFYINAVRFSQYMKGGQVLCQKNSIHHLTKE